MSQETKEEDVEKGRITRKNIGMANLTKLLTVEEKKYLLAVERCDMANVKRMLHRAQRTKSLDINCVDSLGRGALTISIDQENLELVELLIIMGVETKDALLHAINVDFVEAVELLLEHEELIHKEGELYSWQKVDKNTASFTPDITPLILAAHRNNYEILKILLDRGATLPMPHDIKCGCEECVLLSKQDSLRQALSRLNEYTALASPSLIALSSSDPILTAFQLSWELRGLAFAEPECKSEYFELRRQCQQFAVDLLHQSRSSQELAIILNHDPENPIPYEEGEHMQLSRLELAIQYKQKKFVSHPNIQQLLAAIWYEGVPGFRRKKPMQKIAIIVKVALLFPFYCMLYIVAPNTHTGKLMRKPFMKFLIHASSYLFFLLILILVSQRVEDLVIELLGSETWRENVIGKYEKQRGNPPMILEYVVFVYVLGFIVEETHEMYLEGISDYLRNMWNIIDFTRNFLYTAVIVLRIAAYIEQKFEISTNPNTAYLRREEWAPFDFQLVAEGLFAAANIFSAIKLVHLFSINPHLGPLQISLGRMVIDIVKFFFIYSLVLFAFACGLNQLLWYFSDLERQKCFHLPNGNADFDNFSDSCMKWRRFANVFESSQSLFWASFGLVDLSSFELTGIKTYTRFWGLLMFGSYSVINVIVLLNLLIAMMSNSYAIIDEHSDTEWKFARTKLWMSYFEESATLPPPFNIIPTPKMFLKLLGLRKKDELRRLSTKRRNRAEKERDYKYSAVMRALVWRYVAAKHKKEEENPVTEDDVNELKSDISSFRYEIMEVLHRNGMDVSAAEREEKAILGKKNKIWERRLLKDFKVGPIATEDDADMLYAPPPDNETAAARFRRIAKMAILNSGMNKWRQVVKGACIASQIGHCHNKDSFTKQQNLQRAMTEAKKLAAKSPSVSRSVTPINLPDITGSNIINIIADIRGVTTNPSNPTMNLLNSEQSTSGLRKQSDLINLESQKTSPVQGMASSPYNFKYILGDEFIPSSTLEKSNRISIPTGFISKSQFDAEREKNSENNTKQIIDVSVKKMVSQSSEDSSSDLDIIKTLGGVVKDDGQFEIKDVLDTATLIYSAGMVHPEESREYQTPEKQCLSPKLKLTRADGESVTLGSPHPSRKILHFMPQNSVGKTPENLKENIAVRHVPHSFGSPKSTKRETETKLPTEPSLHSSTNSLSEKQIHREYSTHSDKNDVFRSPSPTISKTLPDGLLNTTVEKSKALDPDKHKNKINSCSPSHDSDIIASTLSENRKNTIASDEKKICKSSILITPKELLQEIRAEESVFHSKREKPKGQSVSFSLLDDKIQEVSDLTDPISPEKKTISTKTQSEVSNEMAVSSTLSPNVSRSHSPPVSNDGKSPLASRNIHRVKKTYQPKYGWL